MEKHAGKQGHEGYFKSWRVPPGRQGNGQETVEYEKSTASKALRGSGGLEAELVDKHNDVGEDQRDIDEGIRTCWVEVLERMNMESGRSRVAKPATNEKGRETTSSVDNVDVEYRLVNRINSSP